MGHRIKQLLAEDHVVKVFGLGQLCHPKYVELVGMTGDYDAVWLDHEHAGLSTSQIEMASLAARATGLDSFARLAVTDYSSVMRPLEAGVGGIMAAQVRTAAEAQNLVKWAYFHPTGQRGVNGTGVDGCYGGMALEEYFRLANEDMFLAAQIENLEGLEAADEIAAVPGIDVLFIGPADLTQSMGIPGQWEHPELWRAIEAVAAAATSHDKHWAILPLNPDFARRCIQMGCRMLSLGMDMWVLRRGLRDYMRDYFDVLSEF